MITPPEIVSRDDDDNDDTDICTPPSIDDHFWRAVNLKKGAVYNRDICQIPPEDKETFIVTEYVYIHVKILEKAHYRNVTTSISSIYRKDSRYMTLRCHTWKNPLFVSGRLSSLPKCNFIVTVKLFGQDVCEVRKCNLTHTCQSPEFLLQMKELMPEVEDVTDYNQRRRSTKRKFIEIASPQLQNVVPPNVSSKRSERNAAEALVQGIDNENLIHLTKHQAAAFHRDRTGDTFAHHIDDFTKLQDYFLRLQEADPEGLYCLETIPVSYTVDHCGDDSPMFHRYVVIPSATMHFHRNSRRHLCIDGTHMTSRFDGIGLGGHGKDDNLVPVLLGYGPQENSSNWTFFLRHLLSSLPDTKLLISDNDKGLQAPTNIINETAKQQLNNAVTEPEAPLVFASCAYHVYTNVPSNNSDIVRGLVMDVAKAPTRESYEKRFAKLLLQCPASAEYVEKHKDYMCTLHLMEDYGLRTNYGSVTSNWAESNNDALKEWRGASVVEAVQYYLKYLADIFTKRLTKAKKLKKKGDQVCPHVVDTVRRQATSGRRNWLVSRNYYSGDVGKFILRCGSSAQQYNLELNATSDLTLPYSERIKCPCGYNRSLGHPCVHASRVLVNLKHYAWSNDMPGEKWMFTLQKWFDEVFWVDNYIKQYDVEVRDVTLTDALRPTLLLPPNIVKRKGRKPKARYVSKKVYRCRSCGKKGHNTSLCWAKNSSVVMRLHSAGMKAQEHPLLPSPDVESLKCLARLREAVVSTYRLHPEAIPKNKNTQRRGIIVSTGNFRTVKRQKTGTVEEAEPSMKSEGSTFEEAEPSMKSEASTFEESEASTKSQASTLGKFESDTKSLAKTLGKFITDTKCKAETSSAPSSRTRRKCAARTMKTRSATVANRCHGRIRTLSAEDVEFLADIGRRSTNPFSNCEDVCIKCFDFPIPYKTMYRILPEKWFCDDIIDKYCLLLLQASLTVNEGVKKVHFFASSFMTKLRKGRGEASINYEGVKRWTKKINIFQLEKVFVPINVGGMHWTVLVVDMLKKEMTYYDSFGGGSTVYFQAMEQYLKCEYARLNANTEYSYTWKFVIGCEERMQHNGYDCGVYVVMFCDFVQHDLDISCLNDEVMEGLRFHVGLSLKYGSIHY